MSEFAMQGKATTVDASSSSSGDKDFLTLVTTASFAPGVVCLAQSLLLVGSRSRLVALCRYVSCPVPRAIHPVGLPQSPVRICARCM